MTQRDDSNLDSVNLRKPTKISFTDRKTNEVPQLSGVQCSLIKVISKKLMKYVGHIGGKDRIEKLVLCGKNEGKGSRGRQRKLQMNSLDPFATNEQMTNDELTHLPEIEKTGEP